MGNDNPNMNDDNAEDILYNNDPEEDQDEDMDKDLDPDKESNPDKDKDPDKKPKNDDEDPNKDLFGKPETYDYKDVKLPDGMQLNESTTKKFNEIATKYNMSQKGANEIMALAVAHTTQVQTQLEQAFAQAKEAKVSGYKEALNKDKEIGGSKLQETLTVANIAFEKFSGEKVQDVLAEAGLNCHPEIVKMFYNIGKLMKDDTVHDAGKPASPQKNIADTMYPDMDKKKE